MYLPLFDPKGTVQHIQTTIRSPSYFVHLKFPVKSMRRGGDQKRHGISLPKTLLEQINGAPGKLICPSVSEPVVTIHAEQSSHRHKGGHSHLSRKDARKQERIDRKQRKADHYSHAAHPVKRKTEEEHVDSPQRKRVKISQESVSHPPASKSVTKVLSRHRTQESHTTESVPKQKLKTTALERLVNKSSGKPRNIASKDPRTREEEDEDAYITYLESKLGYAGGGSRRKDDDMDGLGGALSLHLLLENTSHRPCTDLYDFTENIMTSVPVSLLCKATRCIASESPAGPRFGRIG